MYKCTNTLDSEIHEREMRDEWSSALLIYKATPPLLKPYALSKRSK